MDHWLDSIENEELQTDPSLRRFQTLEDALKGHVELKAYQGRSIAVPGEDDTPETWAKFDEKLTNRVPGVVRMPKPEDENDLKRFWQSVGVPESPDEYVAPEGIEALSDEQVTGLREAAAEAGFTTEQFARFMKHADAKQLEVTEAMNNAQAEENDKLVKAWGAAYEDNMSIADTMIEKFSTKEFPITAEQLDPASRAILVNIAKNLTSDPQVFSQISKPTPKRTPAEMRHDLDVIRDQLLQPSVNNVRRKDLLDKQNKIYDQLAKFA